MIKNPPANAGDLDSIHASGKSPGGGSSRDHSSILAWRIPWTEEPGGLQSMGGLKSVRHDLGSKQQKVESMYSLNEKMRAQQNRNEWPRPS